MKWLTDESFKCLFKQKDTWTNCLPPCLSRCIRRTTVAGCRQLTQEEDNHQGRMEGGRRDTEASSILPRRGEGSVIHLCEVKKYMNSRFLTIKTRKNRRELVLSEVDVTEQTDWRMFGVQVLVFVRLSSEEKQRLHTSFQRQVGQEVWDSASEHTASERASEERIFRHELSEGSQ